MRAAPLAEIPPGGAIPALDGLRALSILVVMVAHAGLGHIVPGGLGVTLFFGISGFIITRLLLAEHAARGRIALGAFYLRRVLRLLPALLLYAALVVAVLARLGAPPSWAELVSALFYGANYWALWIGYPAAEGLAPHPFSILWSLAVEEHFYLVFPLLLGAVLRRRAFVPVIVLGVALSLGWRLVIHAACQDGGSLALCTADPAQRIYMATDTRLDAILYGCLLAWACRGPIPRWLAHPAVLALALAVLLGSLVWREPGFRDTWRYAVQSLAIAAGMGSLLAAPALGWLRRGLSLAPLLLIGRMAYVLYLFHWLAVGLACRWTGIAMRDGLYPPAWYAVFLTLTLVPSLAVHFGVERPLLGLRHRFRRVAPRA